MLTIRHIDGGAVRRIALEELPEALRRPGFVWVDLSAPTDEEQLALEDPALGLEPLAIEDMRDDVHLPKLDLFERHILLTIHAIEIETSMFELATIELDVAMEARFLVTYHHRPVAAVEAVEALVDGGQVEPDRPTVVLHHILDVMTDVFVPFLDLLGGRLDLVEEDVVGRPTHATRAEIFALRRDLITLRRISVPQAEVIRRLGRERIGSLSGADRALFRDIHDHLYRMAEVSEAYRQLVESAYDMYRSVRDDETNRRLTVLTMVSTLLLPISVIAGIYGMNFEHMPELREPWAYPLVWAVFGLIIVIGFSVFRAWGWIGARVDEDELRRRTLVERLEIPRLDTILKVPAYGARFALAGGRTVLGLSRRARRRGGAEEGAVRGEER